MELPTRRQSEQVTQGQTHRAQRRHRELHAHGSDVAYEQVLADIRARDARDSARSTAPLTMAADAALLDTSALTIEASVAKAIALVEARRAGRA